MKKIIITHDGTTTLARLYGDNKVVKRAEAKCAPGDEFSFEVGANLAFDRLMGRVDKPEPKPMTIEEISKALGYAVKVVKEDEDGR